MGNVSLEPDHLSTLDYRFILYNYQTKKETKKSSLIIFKCTTIWPDHLL